MPLLVHLPCTFKEITKSVRVLRFVSHSVRAESAASKRKRVSVKIARSQNSAAFYLAWPLVYSRINCSAVLLSGKCVCTVCSLLTHSCSGGFCATTGIVMIRVPGETSRFSTTEWQYRGLCCRLAQTNLAVAEAAASHAFNLIFHQALHTNGFQLQSWFAHKETSMRTRSACQSATHLFVSMWERI